MSSHVAYRLGDGAPVTMESARAIWTAVAREVLEETSSTAPVPHSELARQVQQRSGVYTRMPTSQWLPAVLADLGDAGLAARTRPDAPQAAGRTRAASSRRPRAEPATRKRQETPPPAICPTCFLQLPATGRCDNCG
jgi:transposase